MIRRVVVWASFLSAVGAGLPAASSEAPIVRARLELDPRTAGTCTSPSDFAARVSARSPRIQFVDGPTTIGVQATFNLARSGGVSAELILVEAGAGRTPRRFLARSCAEAADALALMVAVALDPVWVNEHPTTLSADSDKNVTTGLSSPSSTAPRGASAVPSRPGQPPPPVPTETERNQALPPPPEALVASPAAPSPSPAMGPSRRRASAHLAGQSLWGPSPAVMPGMAVYATVALDRNAFLSPAVVLGVFYAWRNNLVEPGGKASFSLVAGSLDACALRARASFIDVRGCATVVAGRLTASGSDTDAPATDARLFAVAGAASILTVHLGRMVELTARVGAGMTLRRNSYEFASTVFHSAARVTTSASIGVGFGFE